ncbi:gamma-aminobutyric acid receptor subunit beta-like isoform X1 [Aphis craccivora]|uniref:Gamma-aminobutyric acid receptor subunit beta-like isoform X1 n=1 Tax=Aphis craccivora TaxID=307492 RepID=A0A6G0ZIN3_APHCR|nr:gamma-aminobutyric acid receptor subunit beta-like isoform X1 [Aphis craccivora]
MLHCDSQIWLNGSQGGGMFGDVNISAILDSFSLSYDKRVRPNYGGDRMYISSMLNTVKANSKQRFKSTPIEVGVTMYVLSISSLSEVKMSFFAIFFPLCITYLSI